jgi:nucleotide-binding universal stress UspA family protein
MKEVYMKILVCTDGSESSQKALKKAVMVAEKCKIDEIAIIHVYDYSQDTALPFFPDGGISITEEEIESLEKLRKKERRDRKNLLEKASEIFKCKNIKIRTIFKEGHPSHTIVDIANKEGFDIIVLGSRGLSGFKKVFLGSVSNAVLHEAKDCSILIVK